MSAEERFVTCRLGHRHWGAFGAAGVLLVHAGAVLLQHRISWSHHGDTWSIPGGAIHEGESALAAALRELAEESGIGPPSSMPRAEHVLDHGGWSYQTFVIEVAARHESVRHHEQVRTQWVTVPDVESLALHPGFAESWPAVRVLLP